MKCVAEAGGHRTSRRRAACRGWNIEKKSEGAVRPLRDAVLHPAFFFVVLDCPGMEGGGQALQHQLGIQVAEGRMRSLKVV